MRVLSVGLDGRAVSEMREGLEEGWRVSTAASVDEVRARLEGASQPTVVLIEVGSAIDALCRSIQPLVPDEYVYLIGMVGGGQFERVGRLLERGFDDVIRRSEPTEVRRARLLHGGRMLRRRRRWQRRESRAAQQAGEQFLRKLTAQIPGAVFEFRITADGRRLIPYMSRGIERLYGLTPEQARAEPSRMFEGSILPEDLERVERAVVESAESLETFEQEFRIGTDEGVKWILVHSYPERRPDGGIVWYGMLREVTRRKQLERQLRLADRLASIGTLSAGLAHEINNPLAYVGSNLAYLQEVFPEVCPGGGGPEEEFGEMERAIGSSLEGVERIERIVKRLEGVSHHKEPELKPVDPSEAIERALDIVGHEIRHGSELAVHRKTDRRVQGEITGLVQVLVNLLTNALHALAETEGSKQLEICVESVGDRVAIDVRDTGPGIAGEDLDRIFDPFYTTKSVDEGTGLGLYISQDIVASMGGRIEVESQPGEGTVFRVMLRGVEPGAEAAPGGQG